ncbi:MAG: hypothetical protein H7A27_06440 [Spirochaetaceae bacterium]|nr:hypothetical protein [Spirochaetaceae bacterium]
MSSWLKALALGIAAALGLSRAAEPPPLTMRLSRDETTIYASVEVWDLPGTDLERLVEASFVVRLEATIWAGRAVAEAYRDIRYNGRYYEIRVSETGGVHRTEDPAAAWAIASRFSRVPLCPAAGLSFPLSAGCKATLSLPEDPGYDPMVVWGYKAAADYREIDSLGHVPYL